jgi:hypothetical protein
MDISDKGPLEPETREVLATFSPAGWDSVQHFLDEHPYPFYAVLLGRDTDLQLKDYVEHNWTNLHYMSGDTTLLLSIYAPQTVDDQVMSYWKGKLGDSFQQVWNESPTAAWSYQYARQLGIPFDKLPCLFIGTDIAKNSGLAVKIPQWDAPDLLSLFEMVFQKTFDSSELGSEQRLESIDDGIAHFYKLRLGGIYVKNHWMEYVNTKEILKNVISILVTAAMTALKGGL